MDSGFLEISGAKYTDFIMENAPIPIHVEVKGFGKVRKATAFRTLGQDTSPPSDVIAREKLSRQRHASEEIRIDEEEKRMKDLSKYTDALNTEAEKRIEMEMKRLEDLNKKSEALAAILPKPYRSRKARKATLEGQDGSS